MVQLSHPCMTMGKTIALTRLWTAPKFNIWSHITKQEEKPSKSPLQRKWMGNWLVWMAGRWCEWLGGGIQYELPTEKSLCPGFGGDWPILPRALGRIWWLWLYISRRSQSHVGGALLALLTTFSSLQGQQPCWTLNIRLYSASVSTADVCKKHLAKCLLWVLYFLFKDVP